MSLLCKKVGIALATKARQFIKMPTGIEEQYRTIRDFALICGFPQVIGAIDCTHIKIRKVGSEIGQYHVNRKGNYSINTQVGTYKIMAFCKPYFVLEDLLDMLITYFRLYVVQTEKYWILCVVGEAVLMMPGYLERATSNIGLTKMSLEGGWLEIVDTPAYHIFWLQSYVRNLQQSKPTTKNIFRPGMLWNGVSVCGKENSESC